MKFYNPAKRSQRDIEDYNMVEEHAQDLQRNKEKDNLPGAVASLAESLASLVSAKSATAIEVARLGQAVAEMQCKMEAIGEAVRAAEKKQQRQNNERNEAQNGKQ